MEQSRSKDPLVKIRESETKVAEATGAKSVRKATSYKKLEECRRGPSEQEMNDVAQLAEHLESPTTRYVLNGQLH